MVLGVGIARMQLLPQLILTMMQGNKGSPVDQTLMLLGTSLFQRINTVNKIIIFRYHGNKNHSSNQQTRYSTASNNDRRLYRKRHSSTFHLTFDSP